MIHRMKSFSPFDPDQHRPRTAVAAASVGPIPMVGGKLGQGGGDHAYYAGHAPLGPGQDVSAALIKVLSNPPQEKAHLSWPEGDPAHAHAHEHGPNPFYRGLLNHPLQHSWTLWYFRNDRSRSWGENQRPVVTVRSIEQFWALYHHLELASKLQAGSDYSLFKEGIKPMWEDELNRSGGRWLVNMDRKFRTQTLDNFWLEVMLMLIGESFGEESPLVNGAVVSVRNRCDKIGVWLADADLSARITHVGQILKQRLDIPHETLIGFEIHEDTKHRTTSSLPKSRYIV